MADETQNNTSTMPGSLEGYAGLDARWAPSSGREGKEIKGSDKAARALTFGVGGVAAWHMGPRVIPKIQEQLNGLAASMGGEDGFVLGKVARKIGNKTPIATNGKNIDFWYKFARQVENTQAGGYFSGLFNIFSRAAYISETLSYGVDRGAGKYAKDFTAKTLGHRGRADALSILKDQFGISDDVLENLDYAVFQNRKLYKGAKVRVGSNDVIEKTAKVLADNAILPDTGRVGLAYLTTKNPVLGLKDIVTNEIRGITAVGREGFFPLNPDKIGGKLYVPGMGMKKVPKAVGVLNSYMAMAVQRTSFLVDEMIGWAKDLTEFINPNLKKNIFGNLNKAGLIPHTPLSSAGSQLFRYAGTAGKVFGALALANQAGFMMQHGNLMERTVGGAGQAAMLAYAGSKVATVFGRSGKSGALVGGAMGLLGIFGIGPFDKGTAPGVGRVLGNLNETRSKIGEFIGLNQIRREIEKFAPGATDGTTAMGLGIMGGIGGVAAHRFWKGDDLITQSFRQQVLEGYEWNSLDDLSKRTRATGRPGANQRYDRLQIRSPGQVSAVHSEIDEYIKAQRQSNVAMVQNTFGKVDDTYQMRSERLGSMITENSFEKARSEVLKDVAMEEGFSIKKLIRKQGKLIQKAPFWKASMYSAVLGVLAMKTMSIGTIETPDEIRAKNSGQLMEEVRKAQGWEFGSQPFEGGEIQYYRPTAIARMQSGASQAGSSGNHGMLSEFILKNFSYKLEKDSYWDRPAPITSGAGDGIPFLYPFLKAGLDIIKRPKLMHVDEWAKVGDSGEIEYLEVGNGQDPLPNAALGGITMAAPASPYSYGQAFRQSFQEITAAQGLVGFYAKEGLRMATGSSGIFDQRTQLESFSKNTSLTERFYDLQTGGGFMGIPFVSEPIRRFLVKNNSEQYNPILNNMPSWLPDSLSLGNQYANLTYGEGGSRLPGDGYAARFQELKGVDAEAYPLMHRFNILGDVAPWSLEYRETKRELFRNIRQGKYTGDQASYAYKYAESVENRIDKRSYDLYAFDKSQYSEVSGTVSSVDEESMTFTLKGQSGRFALAGISNEKSRLIAQINVGVHDLAKVRKRNAQQFGRHLRKGQQVTLTMPVLADAAVDDRGYIQVAAKTDSHQNLNRSLAESGDYASTQSPIARFAMATGAEREAGRAWSKFSHNIGKFAAPVEYLTMFGMAPSMKFLSFRDPLEEYREMTTHGESLRLWQKPFADWFAPAIRMAKSSWLGDHSAPLNIQKQDRIQEYFDKLSYIKGIRAGDSAEAMGDFSGAASGRGGADRTIAGTDGFYDEHIFRSLLGGREEAYALGFARENRPGRRVDILEALPNDKRHIMEGQWAYRELQAYSRMAVIGSVAPQSQARIQSLRQADVDAGYERTRSNQNQYEEHGQADETFGQYMQRSNAERYFDETASTVPDPDWIGFNPAVDLEDVKLKYIQNEGMSFHDFGIYPSRANLIHRKPYINPSAISQIGIQKNALQHARNAVNSVMGMMGADMTTTRSNINSPIRSNDQIMFDINQEHSYIPSEF